MPEDLEYDVVDATTRDEYMSIVQGSGDGRVMLGDTERYTVDICVEELFDSERIGKKAGTIGINGAGSYHRFVVEDRRLMGKLGASKKDDLTHIAKDDVLDELFGLYHAHVGNSPHKPDDTSEELFGLYHAHVGDGLHKLAERLGVKHSKDSQRADLREVYSHDDVEPNDSSDKHKIDPELEGGQHINSLERAEMRLKQIHEDMNLEYEKTDFFPEESLEELEA